MNSHGLVLEASRHTNAFPHDATMKLYCKGDERSKPRGETRRPSTPVRLNLSLLGDSASDEGGGIRIALCGISERLGLDRLPCGSDLMPGARAERHAASQGTGAPERFVSRLGLHGCHHSTHPHTFVKSFRKDPRDPGRATVPRPFGSRDRW